MCVHLCLCMCVCVCVFVCVCGDASANKDAARLDRSGRAIKEGEKVDGLGTFSTLCQLHDAVEKTGSCWHDGNPCDCLLLICA